MSAKGTFPRTLKRLPGHAHRLAQMTPYRLVRRIAAADVPSSWFCFCAVLSYWLNQQDGDCVTAEQCFNIDLASTIATGQGYVVSDADVIEFARQYGLLNGADLSQVNSIMRTNGLPTGDGKLFKVGSEAAVDWKNYEEVCAATIEAKGSLQMAIAAGQLESAADDSKVFNFAFNFATDENSDHCTGLGAGFGTAGQCLDALNAFYAKIATAAGQTFAALSLPSGVDPATPSFIMFSWNRFWIISAASVNAITDEMKIRQPSSIMSTNPTPPAPPAPTPTRRAARLLHRVAECFGDEKSKALQLLSYGEELFGIKN